MTLTVPENMRHLPTDRAGRIVPHFVAWPDGVPDFRIARPEAVADGLRFDACWICGRRVGVHKAFTIGPMCAVNRITAEPAAHRDCARYAVQVCPHLTNPEMRRRPVTDTDVVDPAGVMVRRNPGVTLIWVTRSFKPIRDPQGGVLIEIGPAVRVEWWREGRAATRQEVLDAIDAGMPTLREAAEVDGERGRRVLEREYATALTLVPPA